MTSESQPPQNFPNLNVPPPPPTQSKRQRPKRKKKLLTAGIGAGLAVALAGGGGSIAFSSNSKKLDEYNEALDTLNSTHEASSVVLEEAGALEPALQEDLEAQLAEANALLEADTPGVMSFAIELRVDELRASNSDLRAPRKSLREALENRDSYNSAVSEATEVLEDAEDLLKKTKGKVADKDTYKTLSAEVKSLQKALEEAPEETSGAAFADSAEAIEDLSSAISEPSQLVSASHEEWKEAKDEAEKRDPANYKKISERDWQLIERNPDAHVGEKYVVYGAVTQADINTGVMSIRVDTGGVKKSQWYDYDINTIVTANSSDMFSDIVHDDHLKMLIEITGSTSYETMIGGSASAVDVIAYDVEVIGRF